MKSQQKNTTVLLFLVIVAAIGAIFIVSSRVQKQSTTPTKSNAANCALRFVVTGPTPTATPITTTAPTSSPIPTSTATAKPSMSPTPTASPVGMYRVKVRARFFGVSTDKGDIISDLKIQNGTDYRVTFKYLNNGIYETDIALYNQPAMPTVMPTFSVKPEKHVQKVFKAASIVGGIVDLTAKAFEPGDLPTQDGVVNLSDLNKVLGIIAKSTQTSADLDIADVNYDGVVNAADMSAILTTLSTKPDESL